MVDINSCYLFYKYNNNSIFNLRGTMKCIIIYTFNYYEKRANDLTMLKLSLYSVYHELVNRTDNQFDVRIYTQNACILQTKLDFPCEIIQVKPEDYAIDFAGEGFYTEDCNRFLFIGHFRVLILPQLFSESAYDKYIYMDNDVVVLRGHYDEIIYGLNQMISVIGSCEDITIGSSHAVQRRKRIVEINSSINKYSLYDAMCSVVNGVIILDKSAESIANKILEIYIDLISIHGNLFGHDQTAFSIAYHMIYPNDKPYISINDNLRYIYHYAQQKYLLYDKVNSQLELYSKIHLNNLIQYGHRDDYFESNERTIKSFFLNVIDNGPCIPKIIHRVHSTRSAMHNSELDGWYIMNWQIMNWYIDEEIDFASDKLKNNYNLHKNNPRTRQLICGCNALYKYGGIIASESIDLNKIRLYHQFIVAIKDADIVTDLIGSTVNNNLILAFININWDDIPVKNKYLKHRFLNPGIKVYDLNVISIY
jgi:hypothetical protein